MKELNNLSKQQLKQLAQDLLEFHELHYKAVESIQHKEGSILAHIKAREEAISDAFFTFAGNVQGLRKSNGLPKLY